MLESKILSHQIVDFEIAKIIRSCQERKSWLMFADTNFESNKYDICAILIE